MKRNHLLTSAALVVAFLFVAPALAQDKPVAVPMSNYQAYASGIASAHQAKADQCDSKAKALQTMAAKCASDICLALFADKVERACAESGSSGNVAAVAPPPVEKPWYVELKDTVLDTARVALPVFDRVMASRDSRLARESQDRQTLGLYSAFTGMHGQTVTGMTTLGTAGLTTAQNIATSGFGSLERGMVAGFTAPKEPTYAVNVYGNDNALFGSTSNRSYTNNCTGGNAGNGGTAPSGNAGVEASGSGSGGTATGGSGGQAPCTISK